MLVVGDGTSTFNASQLPELTGLPDLAALYNRTKRIELRGEAEVEARPSAGLVYWGLIPP